MTKTFQKFDLIGIAVKTQNIAQKAEIDIPKLWEKLMQESIVSKIPNKINNDIYAVYTHYEGDYTQPYTTFLGCKVSSTETAVPEGMVALSVATATYQEFVAKGKLADNIVFNKWLEIWKTDIQRTYLADFEIYKEGADIDNTEVPIFVGISQ